MIIVTHSTKKVRVTPQGRVSHFYEQVLEVEAVDVGHSMGNQRGGDSDRYTFTSSDVGRRIQHHRDISGWSYWSFAG